MIAQLQQQVQQQQHDLQAAQAQHHAAQAQAAAMYQQMQQTQQIAYQLAANQANAAHPPPPPPPPRNPVTEAILRVPAQQFDGRRTRYTRVWVADLERRFGVMQPAPTDAEKVAYAATHLVQGAKTWYLRQEHLLVTWADFTAALMRKYQPLNQQDHAVDQLQALRHTRTVAAYCSTFNDLVMELPAIDDMILARMFVNGLQPRLRALVKAQAANMSLEQVQTLADQLEETYLEERAINRGMHINNSVRRPLPHQQARHQPTTVNHREGPAPMELGARQLYRQHRLAPTNRRFVRPTTNTQRVLSTAPTCAHCRRPGHTADQCRARNARPPAHPPFQGNGQRRRH